MRSISAKLGGLVIALGALVTAPSAMAHDAAVPAGNAAPAAPAVTALTGGSVLDVTNGKTISDAVILIEGERIKAVGPAGSVAVPTDAKIIPMDGKWLIPGLMNMHVHLGLKLPGAAGDALLRETDPAEELRMASNAYKSLYAGVTTLRLVGEDHGLDFTLIDAINKGEVIGPRIQTAGEVISQTGGHGSLFGDGPYQLAHLARAQIAQGATWVKIAVSGGIATQGTAIEAAPFTDDEVKILIEAAHRMGAKVTAHNGSSTAALQAMKYGIDGFEHGYHLNETVLKEMKKKGVWYCPTIVVSQSGVFDFFKRIGSPDWYLDRVRSTGKAHWATLQNAIKIGVPIVLGTDQFPFEDNEGTIATVREAELYVEAGMTPLQALQSGTITSAKMLDMDQDTGSITPGKYADIIAVDGNPAKDIHALRTINFVMKGGTVIRDDRTHYKIPAAIE